MLKQVIVMRTDLGMRKGKMVVQGAHASLEFLRCRRNGNQVLHLTAEQQEWLDSYEHKKVCLGVDSLQELEALNTAANAAGLESHVVVDFGFTEFNGEHTVTCLAIGPDDPEKIDQITGHLKLL